MRFEILGPLAVWRDGERITLSGSRQRALLAVLLAATPEPVPVSRLIRVVWTDAEAASTAALKMTVNRVRRWWEQHERGPGIERVGAGYRLTLGAATLDSAGFRARIAAVEALPENAIVERRDMALHALARCRGPVLADLPESVRADPAVAELARLHAGVVHRLTGNCLATGRPELAIPHLELVRLDRLDDERIAADLALALAAGGRPAQGLAVLDELTRRLAEELGVSPGPLIGAARLRVLGADGPDRAAGRSVASTLSAAPVLPAPPVLPAQPSRPPAQLPMDVYRFAGRRLELAHLDTLLDRADGQSGTVVISALSGTAGVGKTALAVHWAHRVQGRFPDGQLYVNLRGFDPAESPTSPSAALRDCLDALGVPAERIPDGLPAQANLYRTMLAERRVLVVLDNARDAEQVRPLLPGSRGCLVVVTSRNQLVGLVAAEGAHPLTLDVLSAVEAHDLLAQRLGVDRVRNEPAATEHIIGCCAGLPLALSIVAARLATNPTLSLATVAGELTRTPDRLDLFAGDDAVTDIRTVFSWSYRALDGEAAHVFRLMGLFQVGPDIGTAAAASLAGLSSMRARPLLDRLVRGHLLTEPAHGRFAFHDLLRAYAAELAHTIDTTQDHDAALGRLLDYYLHSAHAAALALQHFDLATPSAMRPDGGAEAFTGHEPALAWLVTECASLVAAVSRASDSAFFTHSWQLARSLQEFLATQGNWHQLHHVQRAALTAAEQADHPAAQASAHRAIAHAATLLGDHQQAEGHLRRALDLVRTLGDLVHEAYCEHNLAIVCQSQGRPQEALDHERRALQVFHDAGHSRGEAVALNSIGWFLASAGEYQQALDYAQQALAVLRTTGFWQRESTILDTIAYAHLHLSQYRLALDYYRQGLNLSRRAGNRYQQTAILARLGDAYQANDEPELARDAWRQALEILETLDDPTPHPSTYDGYNKLPDMASLHAKLQRPGQGAVTDTLL
jgi:DNA-binding SARP family transcriptional activator/tetratricopeptide (TPR) repeat protein